MAPNPRRKRMEPNNPIQAVAATFNNDVEKLTFLPNQHIKFDNNAPGTVRFSLQNFSPASPLNTSFASFPSNPIQWVRRINESLGDAATNLTPIDPPDGTM